MSVQKLKVLVAHLKFFNLDLEIFLHISSDLVKQRLVDRRRGLERLVALCDFVYLSYDRIKRMNMLLVTSHLIGYSDVKIGILFYIFLIEDATVPSPHLVGVSLLLV